MHMNSGSRNDRPAKPTTSSDVGYYSSPPNSTGCQAFKVPGLHIENERLKGDKREAICIRLISLGIWTSLSSNF